MDDSGTTRVPVTRSRRKISVESEEINSPLGATTPTKTRGGRLAAKPQLEQIDENAIVNSPRKATRKTAVKTDPTEEKVITPSRRSTRIKSTPSVTLEVTNQNTPRAKRAARRSSLAGSDNESLTPIKTRRTRKDSTSSIDKQADVSFTKTPKLSKTIIEEEVETNNDIETNVKSPKDHVENNNKENNHSKSNTELSGSKEYISNQLHVSTSNENSQKSKKTKQDTEPISPVTSTKMKREEIMETAAINNSCDDLLKDLTKKSTKIRSINNKSCTDLELSKTTTSKRHRTKSCSTVSVEHSKLDFYSDNEISKNKKKRKSSLNKDSILILKSTGNNKSFDKNTSILNSKQNTKIGSKNVYEDSDKNPLNTSENYDKSKSKCNEILSINRDVEKSNEVEKLFQIDPSNNMQCSVFIEEDGDSNTSIISKDKPQSDGQDQCVPVVVELHGNEHTKINTSYEPMDVDETVPSNESKILQESNTENMSTINKTPSKFASPISMQLKEEKNSVNMSKRNSLAVLSESNKFENNTIENKSTLILSQINDKTLNEINNSSTKITNIINEGQLSKSVNLSDSVKTKEINKIIPSENYSTSTPLQQKSLRQWDKASKNISNKKKNGNSSLKDNEEVEISSNESNKDSEKILESFEKKSLDNSSQASKEESPRKQNSFIDDEAEEASENYESGDSQNEEDRQYEKDNEIVVKGETLDSEDDFSDDTDYEKDSFVVSSADEDNDLLSGSGDNLSMTDNELNMSSKSKNKYNERKIKEQKKASREMYNARHKLNESESSNDSEPRIKRVKRQRLSSSSIRSNDGQDSEMNTASDPEDFTVKKKKKAKLLSESINAEDNEKEMSIINTSKTDKQDPLLVCVKEEIKTPNNTVNISTITINDKVEEVNVNENISLMKTNETSDPLRTTDIDDYENSSSSSGNEEIMENYNSILNGLHDNTKKIKSVDTSLNEKKSKKNLKEPIVDQLNLTFTKAKKNKKNVAESRKGDTVDKSENIKTTDPSEDDATSDSIDLRLLFSEESNDSEPNIIKFKKMSYVSQPIDIPLKKTEAKTDIHESVEMEQTTNEPFFIDTKGSRDEENNDSPCRESSNKSTSQNTSLASSNKDVPLEVIYSSKKKRNNSLPQTSVNESENAVQDDAVDVLSSGKKKKKSKYSLSTSKDESSTQINLAEDIVEDNTLDIISSGKKKKKSKTSHYTSKDESCSQKDLAEDMDVDDNSFTSGETKKKSRTSLNTSKDELCIEKDLEEDMVVVDNSLTSGKTRKKSKTSVTSKDESSIEKDLEEDMVVVDNSLTSGKTRKKSKTSVTSKDESYIEKDLEEDMVVVDNSLTSGKTRKKSKTSVTSKDESYIEKDLEENMVVVDNSFTNSKSNKKSITSLPSQGECFTQKDEAENMIVVDNSFSSGKKKKKPKMSLPTLKDESCTQMALAEDIIQDDNQTSNGKKKKKSKFSHNTSKDESSHVIISEEINICAEQNLEILSGKKMKKSKQTSNISSQYIEGKADDSDEAPIEITYHSNKNKHQGANGTEENIALELSDNNTKAKNKKKSKKNQNDSNKSPPDVLHIESEEVSLESQSRKKKKHDKQQSESKDEFETDASSTGITKKKTKKRKNRDDEDVSTHQVSKVSKQSYCDKVYVQRLPAHILNQLDDKPRKVTAVKRQPKLLSTTEFIVEETTTSRNKPSNYLEESIYLNDSPPVKRKEKKILKKPKVLPFMPTASTSDEGFTSNFRINVLPSEYQFVAQSSNVTDFKTERLQKNKIKKFRTFEKYKNDMKYKISKF